MKVFVYGTLMSPSIRKAVSGYEGEAKEVTLKNFRKSGLNIESAEGEEVEGMILDVDSYELARLDQYEGISRGLYKKIAVKPEGEKEAVIAYQLVDNVEIFSPYQK